MEEGKDGSNCGTLPKASAQIAAGGFLRFTLHVILVFLASCLPPAGADNPFEKQRPIAPMRFLEQGFNKLETKIKGAEELTNALDFGEAEEALDEVERDLAEYLVGENQKARKRKGDVEKGLKGARKILKYTRTKKGMDDIFENREELNWQKHAETFAGDLKENTDLQKFLADGWGDADASDPLGMYKRHWLVLIGGNTYEAFDYEKTQNMIDNVDEKYKERTQYLAGVAALEQGKKDQSVDAFRKAENFFTYLTEPDVKPLAMKGQAEASARTLLSLLHDEAFTPGAWQRTWGKIWEVPEVAAELQHLSPIPAGLIPMGSKKVSKLEELLKGEKRYTVSPHLKLAWLYSGLGWHEAALDYIQKELSFVDKASASDKFVELSYFYGRSLEETYVQNGFSSRLTPPKFTDNSHLLELDLLELENVYKEASQVAQNSSNNVVEKIDYMRRWVSAYEIYQQAAAENRPGEAHVQKILDAYKNALRICPESFFFRERCFNLFTRPWIYSGASVGFPFHGYDGYYQLVFTGNELSTYAPLVQLISLIQFFDKVTYKQSVNIKSEKDVKPGLIIREFLSGRYSSITPKPYDFRETMRSVYQVMRQSRVSSATTNVFKTHRGAWRAVQAYIDEGDTLKEKNLPLAAMQAYLKSIVLIPTLEAYNGLEAILTQIEGAKLTDTYKDIVSGNLKFVVLQRETFNDRQEERR